MTRTKKYNETKFFTEKSRAEVETNGPETINGTVSNALNVNVRSGAGMDTNVLEVLAKGDKVEILGKNGKFHKVRTNSGKIGFIFSHYLEEG